MKFRAITFTLMGLISVTSLSIASALAQTSAAAPAQAMPPPAAPAPPMVQPAQPAPPVSTPMQRVQQMPPPPPGEANVQLPPPPPAAPINLNSPGAKAAMPAKIVVSGVAATVNGQPITFQYLVTKFIAAGAPQFLDEMINESLIRQEAKREGVTVSPAETEAKLMDAKKVLLPQYPGQSWAQFLALQGRSESYIKDNIYDGLLAIKLVQKSMPPPSLTGKVHLYHILKLTVQVPNGPAPLSDVEALRQLQVIRDAIVSGKATFQDEAIKESQDSSASSGGDLGWLGPQAQLDPGFSKAAFALQEGEVSQPVKSQYGWHLIWAEKMGNHATAADLEAFANGKQEQDLARQQIQPYLKHLRDEAKVVNYVLVLPAAPAAVVGTPLSVPMKPAPAVKPAKKPMTKKSAS